MPVVTTNKLDCKAELGIDTLLKSWLGRRLFRLQGEELSDLGAAAELMQARVAAARSPLGTPNSSVSPFSRTPGGASTPVSALSHHLPPSSPFAGSSPAAAAAAAAAADISAASMALFMQQQAASLQQLAATEVRACAICLCKQPSAACFVLSMQRPACKVSLRGQLYWADAALLCVKMWHC